jgi:D-3-phosphoglycerate dehydrogenase
MKFIINGKDEQSMLKALCTSQVTQETIDKLAGYMEIERVGMSLTGQSRDVNRKDEGKLIEQLQGKDVLIISYEPVTRNVLENCPDLKLIASEREGPEENIDVAAAEELGILIVHSKGRCATSVAEHTILLMLALSKWLWPLSSLVRSGGWKNDKLTPLLNEMQNKTCGIIGLGRNGYAIAQRVKGFGMKVIAYDPYVPAERAAEVDAKMVDLMTVMRESDYVVPMARVSPETIGLIGREQIDAMKPTARFINTARSVLVDYEALLDALEEGRILAVALDVFDKEPLDPNDRIFSIDPERLLITPHIAGPSAERWITHSAHMCRGIMDTLKGEKSEFAFSQDMYQAPAFKDRAGKIFGIVK